MRHNIRGRKFGRTSSQRKSLLTGLAKSLLIHERIRTTLPKAKDLRPYVEKLITIAKTNTLANRRRLIAVLKDNKLASKMMTELATRYAARNGGYTRIIKAGFRLGDNAPVAIIELVDNSIKLVSDSEETKEEVVTTKE